METKPDKRTFHFGDPTFPIESVLGPKTRSAIHAADVGSAFLIKQRHSGDLSTANILATCNQITEVDLRLLKSMIFDPLAYYCGRPMFQRLPGMQNFAIRVVGDRGRVIEC